MKKRKSLRLLLFFLALFAGIATMNRPVEAKAKTVAVIGNKKYSSLEEAVKKVKDNQTIILKQNVKLKDTICVNRDVKFTLDLNKKTVQYNGDDYAWLLRRKVQLVLKNGTIKAEKGDVMSIGYQCKVTSKKNTYIGSMSNTGSLLMNGDKLTGSMSNTGSLTIQKSTFKNKKTGSDLFYNYRKGYILIYSGTFENNAADSSMFFDEGNSTLDIRDGKYTSVNNIIYNRQNAVLKIRSGQFSMTGEANMVSNYGKSMTISGGVFDRKGEHTYAFLIFNNTSASISGGTFSGNCAALIGSRGKDSKLVVSGGKFKQKEKNNSDSYIFQVDLGTITLKKMTFKRENVITSGFSYYGPGTIILEDTKLYSNYSPINMSGGSIYLKSGLISMKQDSLSVTGRLYVSGGKIYSKTSNAVHIGWGGTLYQTGGILQTDQQNCYVISSTRPDGAGISLKGGKRIAKTPGYEVGK